MFLYAGQCEHIRTIDESSASMTQLCVSGGMRMVSCAFELEATRWRILGNSLANDVYIYRCPGRRWTRLYHRLERSIIYGNMLSISAGLVLPTSLFASSTIAQTNITGLTNVPASVPLQVVNFGERPSWSRDGARLAFMSYSYDRRF
jgi:hypothetical protein